MIDIYRCPLCGGETQRDLVIGANVRQCLKEHQEEANTWFVYTAEEGDDQKVLRGCLQLQWKDDVIRVIWWYDQQLTYITDRYEKPLMPAIPQLLELDFSNFGVLRSKLSTYLVFS